MNRWAVGAMLAGIAFACGEADEDRQMSGDGQAIRVSDGFGGGRHGSRRPDAGAATTDAATATPDAATATPDAGSVAPDAGTPAPAGVVYYTSTSGSDTNPGTASAPFKTLAKGVSVLKPSETLLVGPGTYAESLSLNIPSGTSWAAPVTVRAQDAANRPVLRPSSGVRVAEFQNQQFIVVDGFVMDAGNLAYDVVKFNAGSHHIRLKSSELRNAAQQGIMNTAGEYLELIDLDIHDNGKSDFFHGIYVAGSNNVIDGCRIYRNAGWGVHVYSEGSSSLKNNVVRNSHVYDNARLGLRGDGIILASGSGHQAYNNIVRGNMNGIVVNYSGANAAVFNNTVVGNRGEHAIYIGAVANTVVRNNIVYQNQSDTITNQGTGTISNKNLVGIDPRFVNASALDFRLQLGSPAVDDADVTTVPAVDFNGVTRPRGAGPDIGAFESH